MEREEEMKKIAIILFLSISMFYLGQVDKIFAETESSPDWENSEAVKEYWDETWKLIDLSKEVNDTVNKVITLEINFGQERAKDLIEKIDYWNKRMEEIRPPEGLKPYHAKLKSYFESLKPLVQNINNLAATSLNISKIAQEMEDALLEWIRITAEKGGTNKKGN